MFTILILVLNHFIFEFLRSFKGYRTVWMQEPEHSIKTFNILTAFYESTDLYNFKKAFCHPLMYCIYLIFIISIMTRKIFSTSHQQCPQLKLL